MKETVGNSLWISLFILFKKFNDDPGEWSTLTASIPNFKYFLIMFIM